MESQLVMAGIVVALIVSLFAASKLSVAGRISTAVQPLVGRIVDVRVWGTPITGVRVHAIRAFGAGLLIFLTPESGGKPVLLKVAQPQSSRQDSQQLVIDDARYVQWRSAKMPRVDGAPALELAVTGVS